MEGQTVRNLISEKRIELEEMLEEMLKVRKNLINEEVLRKSEELDKAILLFMKSN